MTYVCKIQGCFFLSSALCYNHPSEEKKKNRKLQEVNLTFKGGLKGKRQMQVTDAVLMIM